MILCSVVPHEKLFQGFAFRIFLGAALGSVSLRGGKAQSPAYHVEEAEVLTTLLACNSLPHTFFVRMWESSSCWWIASALPLQLHSIYSRVWKTLRP